jgi:hypothetical protein
MFWNDRIQASHIFSRQGKAEPINKSLKEGLRGGEIAARIAPALDQVIPQWLLWCGAPDTEAQALNLRLVFRARLTFSLGPNC